VFERSLIASLGSEDGHQRRLQPARRAYQAGLGGARAPVAGALELIVRAPGGLAIACDRTGTGEAAFSTVQALRHAERHRAGTWPPSPARRPTA
jgi:hypothetical protein